MKPVFPYCRAFAALLVAGASIATPALAQQTAAPTAPAAPTVTPPQVVPTVPQDDSVTSRSTPPARNGSVGDPNSATPVNAEAVAQAEEEAAQRRNTTRAAPRPEARPPARPSAGQSPASPAPVARTAAPAPAPTAPTIPQPTAASPVTAAPTPAPAPAVVAPSSHDAGTTGSATSTTTTDRAGGFPIWPFVALGLLIVAAGAFFLSRRRGQNVVEPAYFEDTYVEPAIAAEPMTIEPVVAAPVAVAEPVAARAAFAAAPPVVARDDEPVAAPAMPDDVQVASADAEDVAALTGAAPVGDRPWLEFAMRPIRAGSNVDEALVDIDLTVGNAGQVAAHDVRISTFMLADGAGQEMRGLFADPPADAAVDPVTIEPGEGTRVEATLAVLKADLPGGFDPIVGVDARYRLADGTEGRTSAAFMVGRVDGDTGRLRAIEIDRPQMFDDVEAQFFREPEHA